MGDPLDRICGACPHTARRHSDWWDADDDAGNCGMGCVDCDCDDLREPSDARSAGQDGLDA